MGLSPNASTQGKGPVIAPAATGILDPATGKPVGANDPYFLEVNPLPGLNPISGDLVILSERVGWSYTQLIASVLQAAQKRQ